MSKGAFQMFQPANKTNMPHLEMWLCTHPENTSGLGGLGLPPNNQTSPRRSKYPQIWPPGAHSPPPQGASKPKRKLKSKGMSSHIPPKQTLNVFLAPWVGGCFSETRCETPAVFTNWHRSLALPRTRIVVIWSNQL